MRRSYTFQSAEAARGFIDDFLTAAQGGGMQAIQPGIAGGPSSRGGMMPITVGRLHDIATDHGGTARTVVSSDRKENLLYRYPATIRLRDRVYLHERDGTTKMLLEDPAIDTFLLPPQAFNDTLDNYLEEQWILYGAQRATIACDVLQARDGASFLYAVGSGRPDQPLEPGEPIVGYDHIGVLDLASNSPEKGIVKNPFLPFGYEYLVIQPRNPDGSDGKPYKVHWTRTLPFLEDFLPRTAFGRSKVDAMFNDLWNLTDIVSASTKNTEQGNPIVFDVDIENGFHIDPKDTEKIEALRGSVEDFLSGAVDYIGPNLGIKMRRLGKNDLEDPTPNARIIASKIAAASGTHTANHILAQSRGSEQVTDLDLMTYASRIANRCWTHALRVVHWIVKLGHNSGSIPKRTRLPLRALRWHEIRKLNPREEIFVVKSAAQALMWLDVSGRDAPAWLEAAYPINEEKLRNLRTLPNATPGTADTPSGPIAPQGTPAQGATALNGPTMEEARRIIMSSVLAHPPLGLHDPEDSEALTDQV